MPESGTTGSYVASTLGIHITRDDNAQAPSVPGGYRVGHKDSRSASGEDVAQLATARTRARTTSSQKEAATAYSRIRQVSEHACMRTRHEPGHAHTEAHELGHVMRRVRMS